MQVKVMVLLLVVSGLFCRAGEWLSLFPDSPDDCTYVRCQAVSAQSGGCRTLDLSCDRWSGLQWTPPKGRLDALRIRFRTVRFQPGVLTLKVIDADGEKFSMGFKGEMALVKGGRVIDRQFKLTEFGHLEGRKKKDGVISFPLRSVYVLFYGRPVERERFARVDLEDVSGHYLEKVVKIGLPCDPVSWEVTCHDGAAGGMRLLPNGQLELQKSTAEGVLEFRMKEPVTLSRGRWFLRSEYRRVGHGEGALFFYRLVPHRDSPANLLPGSSMTLPTDTYLVNAPEGEWTDRIYSIPVSSSRSYYPVILMLGNPARLLLRGLRMDPDERIRRVPDIPAPAPAYTRQEVDEILARRTPLFCQVAKDSHGNVTLLLNGCPVVPALYKHEGASRYEHMFRYEDFAGANVPFAMVNLPLHHDLSANQVILGPGRYDWSKVDEAFYRVLRRVPHGNLFIRLSFYEPYLGWGREHWQEVWTNPSQERGLGNNCHLKYFSNEPEKQHFPEKVGFWPSYSSRAWRSDYGKILHDVLGHIMRQPYGKAVAGACFSGGDDGQFQYRHDDYSVAAHTAFREFLRKKYGRVETMNERWNSRYSSFDEVAIPVLDRIRASATPFLSPGVAMDYRLFQEREGWELREHFARCIKEGSGKPIVTLVYGAPDTFLADGLAQTPSLDGLVMPRSYPQRRNCYPYSAHPEVSYRLHGKLWVNELDLRSWRSRISTELVDRWMNAGMNFPDWLSSHRKVLGPSFAYRQGWWYYSLPYQGGRFFDDPQIMSDIKKVQSLYQAMQRLPYRPFRPDVCVVVDKSSNCAISAYPYAAYGNPNGGSNSNGLNTLMKLAGVPYDRAYLEEILTCPELQNYKIYVFLHHPVVTGVEREGIRRVLKNKGRTLVWVYSTGYLDEDGKSTDNMRELTGFSLWTEETYGRQQVYSKASHPLNGGRREVMSYVDLNLSLQMPFGLKDIWGAPCQIFRPTDLKASEIVSEDSDGRPAGGFRSFPGWHSLLLTTPNGLTPNLLHNLAVKQGAYHVGKCGHDVVMNGNFVSIHPLFDDEYEFHTPPGIREVIEAESGKVLGTAPGVKLKLTCGKTLWLFMR